MTRTIFIFLLMTFSISAQAEVIEFPEEELATESVLPVFENPKGVKNRLVKTAGRFEFGVGGGLMLNEPFFEQLNFGFNGTYHFDEEHAFNLAGVFLQDKLSSYGQALQAGEGLDGGTFDPSLAPHPTNMILASYQFTAYYGKISLTKQSVMNLSLYGIAGLGTVGMTEGSAFALNFGLGQKLYFSPDFALRFDLRFLTYSAPDPTSIELEAGTGARPASDFEEELYFNTLMTVGAVFLL